MSVAVHVETRAYQLSGLRMSRRSELGAPKASALWAIPLRRADKEAHHESYSYESPRCCVVNSPCLLPGSYWAYSHMSTKVPGYAYTQRK